MPVWGGDEINAIVQAVRAIHCPTTPNDQRIYCTQAIENLKDGSPVNSIVVAFGLVQHDEQPVRHVGWNIIEHIIRYKWLEIDAELRVRIRNEVLHHVSKGLYSMGVADSLIKTSISRAVVFMMENEWPQNWPELFPQFRQVVETAKFFPQSQMVFIVLKRLIEDVITMVTIEDVVKRRDLSTSISAHMPEILEMSIAKLHFCISAGINGYSCSFLEESIYLAKSIIELLSEIVEWVSNTILDKTIDTLVDVLCAYLKVELLGVYEEAARCLWKLASRKNIRAQEMPIVTSLFRDNPIRTILTTANLAAGGDTEHYKYLKTLCDLMCALGVHLSDVWAYIPSKTENFAPNFRIYLSALSAFFVHPSIYIRAETAQVLSAFSAHEAISHNADFQNCIVPLFQYLPRCMERAGVMNPLGVANSDENLTVKFSQLDCNDEDDLLRDFLVLRERCCKIIRENTPNNFEHLFAIVNDWITNRFVAQSDIIESDEFDMMKRFINTLFAGAAQFEGVVTLEIQKRITALFDVVFLRISTLNSPKTVNGALSILSALFQTFEQAPDRVPNVLERFKVLLMIENPNNTDAEILSLKRHCIVLLLKMIMSYPNAVKAYAQLLLNIVVEVADRVSTMQRATLVHVLGALSNLIGSLPEQQMFLQSALQHTLLYLKSDVYLSSVSSVPNFFHYIGLITPAPQTEQEMQQSCYFDNRLTLRSHLNAIEGLLQYVNLAPDNSSVLYPLLCDVVPSVFHLAKILNAIYSPEFAGLIHASYGPKIFDITAAERQIIYFSMLETEVKEQTSTNNVNDPVAYTRRYIVDLTEMMENVLGLFGNKMAQEFYESPLAPELLFSTLYSVENVPDCRKRFWIRRTWSKLICSCPPEKSEVVVKLTAGFTQHLQSLITERWETIRNRNAEDDPTEEELFVESVTSVLCREYASFLKNLVMGETTLMHKCVKRDTTELLDPLARALFEHKEILDNVIVSMVKLINCPDTQAAIRVIPVANVIISNYFSKIDEQMAHSIFILTIQSLQIHGPDEVTCGPLLNLIFSIYSLLRPIHPSLIGILSQVPQTVPDVVSNFDTRVMTMVAKREKLVDKNKRDLMRKILKPIIGTTIGEQHRRPVQLRRVN